MDCQECSITHHKQLLNKDMEWTARNVPSLTPSCYWTRTCNGMPGMFHHLPQAATEQGHEMDCQECSITHPKLLLNKDMKWTARNVSFTPFDHQHVTTTLSRPIDDAVLSSANVLHTYFFTWCSWTNHSNQQHTVTCNSNNNIRWSTITTTAIITIYCNLLYNMTTVILYLIRRNNIACYRTNVVINARPCIYDFINARPGNYDFGLHACLPSIMTVCFCCNCMLKLLGLDFMQFNFVFINCRTTKYK